MATAHHPSHLLSPQPSTFPSLFLFSSSSRSVFHFVLQLLTSASLYRFSLLLLTSASLLLVFLTKLFCVWSAEVSAVLLAAPCQKTFSVIFLFPFLSRFKKSSLLCPALWQKAMQVSSIGLGRRAQNETEAASTEPTSTKNRQKEQRQDI